MKALASIPLSLAISKVGGIFPTNSRGKVLGKSLLGLNWVMHPFLNYCVERTEYFDWLNMDHMCQHCGQGKVRSHDGHFVF